MKLKLTIIFAILVSLFCLVDTKEIATCDDVSGCYGLYADNDDAFVQDNGSADLYGRRVNPVTFSLTHSLVKRTVSRREAACVSASFDALTTTILSSESCARHYGCPLNSMPERELFFILRNIRI